MKKIPWGQKLAMYRRLALPIVYGAMLKAQQLAIAMEARGFRAYPRRTYLRRLEFYWADYVIMAIFLTGTIILMIQPFI